MFTSGTRTVGNTLRWIVLLPVLMVGSLLYWSVAIGLGGLSLMTASALSAATDTTIGIEDEPAPQALDVMDAPSVGSSIMVHLEESVEPEDVNDNAGAAGFTQLSDDQQVIVAPGPVATSY
jgi:hypothetical protein